MKKIKVLLAQIHLRLGVSDEVLSYNCEQIKKAYVYGADNDCDVVLCPELCISGYSPQDLLLRQDVQIKIDETQDKLCDEILEMSKETTLIFGSSQRVFRQSQQEPFPQGLHLKTSLDLLNCALANAAIIINPLESKIDSVYKVNLPNWGVFDENRWFAAAQDLAQPVEINGTKVGVVICRDIWREQSVAKQKEMGAEIILVPNASPYANTRDAERKKIIASYSKKYGIPIVYVNSIQGCDETICEGGSFVASAEGELLFDPIRFEEAMTAVEVDIADKSVSPEESVADLSGDLGHDEFEPEETYKAICLATKEFINAINANTKVVIGLSGGIDSALVAAIAVDALGPERVEGVMMPSQFTSQQSIDDATELAKRLGINHRTISIEKLHETARSEFNLESLDQIVDENIQPRIRAMILMMLSNSEGALPLATSNKSESGVGYTTMYGDAIGAYAPLIDVYKTQVFELCKWRNSTDDFSITSPIPDDIITRKPTAELKESQTDEEALLPYKILDGILMRYIDIEMSIEEIIDEGFEEKDVRRIVALVNKSEFKRKQAPVGPRLTRRSFGKGRRIPISAKI